MALNLAKKTEAFIEKRPYLKQCLRDGLLNYSALARFIMKAEGLEGEARKDAILVAARRYREKLHGGASLPDVHALLQKSTVEVKNKVAVMVLSKKVPTANLFDLEREIVEAGEPFHLVEGHNTLTLVTSQAFHDKTAKHVRGFLKKTTLGLVEILVKSPPEIEHTPGVVAYLVQRLAERNINVLEMASCWTDTLFVVDEKDLARALEAVSF